MVDIQVYPSLSLSMLVQQAESSLSKSSMNGMFSAAEQSSALPETARLAVAVPLVRVMTPL